MEENSELLTKEERATRMPYNKETEFDFEKLSLGSHLGSGAFGTVLKAQARGILKDEKVTTVAVKTLKPQPEMHDIKSLMSELKILQHIGRHPNLLNLLGACTKRLDRKQLYVILEYCHMGRNPHQNPHIIAQTSTTIDYKLVEKP